MNACVSAAVDIRRHLESAARSVEVRDIRLYHDPSGWGQAEATIVLGDGSTIAGGFDYDTAGGLTVEPWPVEAIELANLGDDLLELCDGWPVEAADALLAHYDSIIRPAVPGLPLVAALRAARVI